jgi:DMSO reductase family type II enzyme chaperone
MQTQSETPSEAPRLQASIDLAVARTFIYRFLAKAFEDPSPQTWAALTDESLHDSLLCAAAAVEEAACGSKGPRVLGATDAGEMREQAGGTPAPRALQRSARAWLASLSSGQLDQFRGDYNAAFGHAARGLCPLNEIEYGELKADPLFQPHRLADLAAFYQAFGLEISPDAAERHDHICLELEFMAVLAAKEAYALEYQLDQGQLALCRDAQRTFLREHLARWTPAFTRRLAHLAGPGTSLAGLASFTREFIAAECAQFDFRPGSEEMLLRPVDAAAESLCDTCGIASRFPGAMQACGET